MTQVEFKVGDKVVYPSHGVGNIIKVETQSINETKVQFYILSMISEKMTIKVPVHRACVIGLRKLTTTLDEIYSILKKKASNKNNKVWNRRVVEYENKINSGKIECVAEVVRDLYRESDIGRSFSESNIYKSALNRLAEELAAIENIDLEDAKNKLTTFLKEKLAAAA